MNSAVSVVIPAHNYGRFLPECLESLFAQSVAPCEILVVDDSSTDDTPEILRRYGDRIRSLRVEGRGAYGARNDAIPHLRGDFFLNVDADNRLDPRFIEKTVTLLAAAPESIGYVYTQRAYFGDRDGASSFPAFDPQRLLLHNFVDMGSLIRMDLVRKHRFDERFNRGCGDHAFFLSLLRGGAGGLLLDEPLLHYRVHGSSITSRVRRRYDQCEIQKLLISTFPELYTPGIAALALAEARNRTLVSILQNRSPSAPLAQRWRDFAAFTRTQPRHAEWPRQFLYLLHPAWLLKT